MRPNFPEDQLRLIEAVEKQVTRLKTISKLTKGYTTVDIQVYATENTLDYIRYHGYGATKQTVGSGVTITF